MLWFGWFGFNAGSALGANSLAGSAFLNTNLAAAAALLAWTAVEWKHAGKPTALGAASGAVAGLVCITPACGYVEPWAALVIGALAGAVCYFGLFIKGKFKLDDALDVLGIHGVGGTLGAILTGVFALAAVGGASGLIDGNGGQVGKQFIAVASTWIYSGIVTFIILKVVDHFVGLRVEEAEEDAGLDSSQHGEVAWQTE